MDCTTDGTVCFAAFKGRDEDIGPDTQPHENIQYEVYQRSSTSNSSQSFRSDKPSYHGYITGIEKLLKNAADN